MRFGVAKPGGKGGRAGGFIELPKIFLQLEQERCISPSKVWDGMPHRDADDRYFCPRDMFSATHPRVTTTE